MEIIRTKTVVVMSNGVEISEGRIENMRAVAKRHDLSKFDLIRLIIPFCEGLGEANELAKYVLEVG